MLTKKIELFDEGALPPNDVLLIHPIINLYVRIQCNQAFQIFGQELRPEEIVWGLKAQTGQWYIQRGQLDLKPFKIMPIIYNASYVEFTETLTRMVEKNLDRGFEIYSIFRQNRSRESNVIEELINIKV